MNIEQYSHVKLATILGFWVENLNECNKKSFFMLNFKANLLRSKNYSRWDQLLN